MGQILKYKNYYVFLRFLYLFTLDKKVITLYGVTQNSVTLISVIGYNNIWKRGKGYESF